MRRDAARRTTLNSTANLNRLGTHDLDEGMNGMPRNECGAFAKSRGTVVTA
jgi:hypothetical protein